MRTHNILFRLMLCLAVILLYVVVFASAGHAQTLYVSQFDGKDTAQKIANAQLASNPALPCALIINPLLPSNGSNPVRAANCTWVDYRTTPPTFTPAIPGGASKNDATDAVLYVSGMGSNANDGLSWSSAKLTLLGAVRACNALVNNHGCVIYDTAPETFSANPFAATYGAGTTTKSLEVHLGLGMWATNVGLLLGHNQQLIGSGRPNNSMPCGANSVGTCLQAGASFPAATPLISEGNAAITGLLFAARVENLQLDCKDVAGSIGILATGTNEQAGARRTMITSCKDTGIRLTAGQNAHTSWSDLEIYPSTTGGASLGVDIPTGVAGGGDWDRVTIVYPGVAGTTAFRINNGQEIISKGLHVENVTNGVLWASSTVNQDQTFIDTTGNANVTNLFHNTGSNGGVSILGWATLGGAKAILDDTNGVSVADAFGGFYSWDSGGKQFSPAKYIATLSPAAVAINTCAVYSATVTGILATDTILKVTKPTEQAGLSLIGGRATAANTVALQFCNNTAGAITPTAAESYVVMVSR